jgi:hypothetical protein
LNIDLLDNFYIDSAYFSVITIDQLLYSFFSILFSGSPLRGSLATVSQPAGTQWNLPDRMSRDGAAALDERNASMGAGDALCGHAHDLQDRRRAA